LKFVISIFNGIHWKNANKERFYQLEMKVQTLTNVVRIPAELSHLVQLVNLVHILGGDLKAEQIKVGLQIRHFGCFRDYG